jgi:hypothetical protein
LGSCRVHCHLYNGKIWLCQNRRRTKKIINLVLTSKDFHWLTRNPKGALASSTHPGWGSNSLTKMTEGR